jgi:hypothetical protein
MFEFFKLKSIKNILKYKHLYILVQKYLISNWAESIYGRIGLWPNRLESE